MKRDRRARATGRLGVRKGERYALVPVEVLGSAAYATLNGSASRVLFALAAQYHGGNNGRLTLPYSVAKGLGIRSKDLLTRGLAELEQRGLIELTRRGGLPPFGCSRYALGWQRIDGDDAHGLIPAPAPNRWAKWNEGAGKRRSPPKPNQNASPAIGPACPDHRTTDAQHWSDHRTTEAGLLVRPSGTSKTRGRGDTGDDAGIQLTDSAGDHDAASHGPEKPQELRRDLGPSIRKLLDAGQSPVDVQKILSSRGCTLHDIREALP